MYHGESAAVTICVHIGVGFEVTVWDRVTNYALHDALTVLLTQFNRLKPNHLFCRFDG